MKKNYVTFSEGAKAFDKLMNAIGYENAVAILVATATTAQFVHCVGIDS